MRFGQILKLKDGMQEEYERYHADVWPTVLDEIKKSNISNYSIFFRDGYLFAYFEYNGDNFEEDMKKMAESSETQRWWDVMTPMQQPVESAGEGEWWVNMKEVFHLD